MKSVNPFTGELNFEFQPLGMEECISAAKSARDAVPEWRALGPAGRTPYLRKAAELLRKDSRRLAEIITREMGKPIRQAVGEIEKCAMACEYYADNAAAFLEDEHVETGMTKSYVAFEPLGVIFGIMPWNFPFWQVFRFAVPALAAGNACLLKHASNVPMCALEIGGLFKRAGLPPGVFQTLLIGSGTAMELIDGGHVDGVSLTGSVEAGSQVAATAGRNICRIVLELGGSDPFVVLDDADIETTAGAAVLARTQNAGQSCIAGKRFIVAESIAESFVSAFTRKLLETKIGDPMDESTDIGPLARPEFLEDLRRQVDDALGKGARLIEGPQPPEGKGFFFRPCILTGVTEDMEVFDEEVFGPVAPVVIAKDEEDALRLANRSRYGLGSSVWSRDLARAEAFARRIDAGFVAVNDIVKSDPRLPFGGIKRSGVGRELSHYGLKEFVNIKTVVVK